ncbi:MAG: hypothetical protein KDB14_09840 [Planctomycetales bacterium]|nr:hypothetical protein [Planctomycetales bacterium]
MEVLTLWFLFALMADSPPPGVNEAHYLAKARHYWDPSFCSGDLFLESADAHLVFYWTFGWITTLTSLTTAAWIGRIVVWGLLASGWQRLVTSVLPFRGAAVLSGVAFVLLQRNLHMAGEWVLGGVEAKCFAYGLVFHALAFIARGRWVYSWPLLGAATAFHVLVGGWSLVAASLAFMLDRERRPLAANALSIIVALMIASLGLWPALQLNSQVKPEIASQASEILVFKRLPHHLSFSRFRTEFLIRMGLAMVAWAALWQQMNFKDRRHEWRRLQCFVAGSAAICAIGAAIDLSLSTTHPLRAASLLRFYWYRLADVMIPLGVLFGLLYQLYHLPAPIMRRLAMGMCWALVMWFCGQTVRANWTQPLPGAFVQLRKFVPTDERPEQFRQWLAMCRWMQQNTPPESRVLAPRGQQTLKWYAFRGEVSNWKDVPQDAGEVVRWYERQQRLFPRGAKRDGLTYWSDRELLALMDQYEANLLLLDRDKSKRVPDPAQLERVYPPAGTSEPSVFEVYRRAAAPELPLKGVATSEVADASEDGDGVPSSERAEADRGALPPLEALP